MVICRDLMRERQVSIGRYERYCFALKWGSWRQDTYSLIALRAHLEPCAPDLYREAALRYGGSIWSAQMESRDEKSAGVDCVIKSSMRFVVVLPRLGLLGRAEPVRPITRATRER